MTSTSPTPTPDTPASPPPKSRNAIDDILGLFGDSTSTPSQSPINTMVPALGGMGNSLTSPTHGGGSPMSTLVPQSAFSLPQAQSPPQQPPLQQKLTAYTAYEKNELKVTLTPQTNPNKPEIVNVLARFQAMGQNTVSGLSFQVAVPKVCFLPSIFSLLVKRFVLQSQQLQMLAMSNPNVNPGCVETQQMKIKVPAGVRPLSPFSYPRIQPAHWLRWWCSPRHQSQIRLRLRLSFLIVGQQIQEQVDFSGFPPNLTTGGL